MNDDGAGARATVMAAARRLYGEEDLTIDGIAVTLGIGRTTILRAARREGWPRRRDRRLARVAATGSHDGGPVDRRAMAARLERLVAGRMAAIEAEPATDPASGERQARTLAHLARTAATVRTYIDTLDGEGERHDDAAPPRSLSELRDELRGHLERIREEERRSKLRGDAEPE